MISRQRDSVSRRLRDKDSIQVQQLGCCLAKSPWEHNMIHLSGVDASFLHMETPEMPMHVGSLHLLDLPEGYTGDFFDDVMKHVSSRLHLASVFERKLAQMPFEMSNPVWVDDDDIDLEYHIRRVVLSKPGTLQQLEQYVGRLHSTLLDRSRPLWEMFVFEGLESGKVALYAKVHHAAVDGQAGVALAKALYDISAEPRQLRQPRERRRGNQYQLGMAELATAAMQNTMQQYMKLVTTLPDALRALATVAMPALNNLGKLQALPIMDFSKPNFGLPSLTGQNFGQSMRDSMGMPSGVGFGPRTPLNVSITNQRAFAGRSVSLKDTKAVAKHAGVSLNDVVMAACAGALRRYMADLNVTLDKAMTAAIPVSLREAGNSDPNNQVTMMLATLATDIKDPLERLKAIHTSTTASKELTGNLKAAIPTDFPSFGAPWIMTGLATLFGRSKVSDQIPPVANVAISNVPGVPVPLYVAGARMATYFPVSIPAHGCALNITVQSYNGSLDYGLTACRRAVPDVADLADYIVAAHAELQTLVMATPSKATAPPKEAAASKGETAKGDLGVPRIAPVEGVVPMPMMQVAKAAEPTAVSAPLVMKPAQAATASVVHGKGNGNGRAGIPTTTGVSGRNIVAAPSGARKPKRPKKDKPSARPAAKAVAKGQKAKQIKSGNRPKASRAPAPRSAAVSAKRAAVKTAPAKGKRSK
jgi:diacylglycerol O-acyltransferase / wax synthase